MAYLIYMTKVYSKCLIIQITGIAEKEALDNSYWQYKSEICPTNHYSNLPSFSYEQKLPRR